jgi:TolB protein
VVTAWLRLMSFAVLLAALLAACGSSSPKGPPELLFVSTRDGDYAVFGADADGRHARRLTKEHGDPATPAGLFFQLQPAWSPDGTEIAFASRRDGKYHIYVMSADGTRVRRLTSSAKDDNRPGWSPDGVRIVFSREGALFRVPSAGGAARRVGKGFGNADDPAWSPDGSRIAYDYRQPGSLAREVYVMQADGTHARRVTRLGETSALPAWSPDGRRLAFQSRAGNGHVQIYTIRADGTGARRLTNGAADSIEPAWSPDGRLIAFSLDGAIATVDLQGKVSKLTNADDNDSSPAWRPAAQATK